MENQSQGSSSSDFVSRNLISSRLFSLLTRVVGSQAVQVRRHHALVLKSPFADARDRMLENPTDENVVRWGNDGDSFVVLEVCCATRHGL